MNGDGSGKPKGIRQYTFTDDASATWGTTPASYEIGKIKSGVNGDLAAAPDGANRLSALLDSLKVPYRRNATWMMSREMQGKLRGLQDSSGQYQFQTDLASCDRNSLFGYPVVLAEDMPAAATGVAGALFGDFSQTYSIVDRSEISVIRDVYSQPGFVKWYMRKRTGGALTNPEAIKVFTLEADV